VQVDAPKQLMVETPFLLEQALACLIQNAIQALDRDCAGKGPRKAISVVATDDRITVANPGDPIPAELRALINESTTPDSFERRALKLVRSAGIRPGIGLVEAYTIASQCYGGLRIEEDSPAVSILLRRRSWSRSRFLSTVRPRRRVVVSGGVDNP